MSTYILRKGKSTLADLANGNSAFMALAAAGGQVFYVDAANGNDGNSGLSSDQARKTILSAYNSCTSGNNDIVALIANATSNTLSAALVWAKSYTHLVGLCAPTTVGQRARIFQLATLTGASPLLTISGSGCSFSNFYIFQGVDDATSLINVKVTGGRNFFENVHFAGSGHVTQAINGGASLNLNGSAAENTFVGCTFGVDTAAAATGVSVLLLDGGTSTVHTTRNVFKECRFTVYAGHAAVAFVELMQITAIDRYMIFEDCVFLNLSATAMTQAFVVPAGFDKNDKRIILKDCLMLGAGKWDNGDTGAVYGNMNAVTGADTSGLAVELIT